MKKDTILGILAVIWFVGSIVAMFWISVTAYSWLMPAIIGQYFLVFGILGINSFVQEGKFGYDV